MEKWQIKSVRPLPPVYQGNPRATIAVAGRSNCGKSTLINALLGQKIAATSKSPGRTRKVQRYLINDRFDLVDLPGYGFAKVGAELRESWRDQVTDFLSGHGNLRRLLVLVDIRRGLGKLDQELLEWAALEKVEPAIILTKADKLSRNQQLTAQNELRSQLSENIPYYVVSALNKIGLDELRKAMLAWWLEDAFQPGR